MPGEQQLKNSIKAKRTLKFFTLTEGIAARLLSQLTHFGEPDYEWVHTPEVADYFVFPCNYEVAHDPERNGQPYFENQLFDMDLLLAHEQQLIALAQRFGKKIILIYFNDSSEKIDVKNAIIFRTSIEKSKSGTSEISMPVIKVNLSAVAHRHDEFVEWQERPAVGFRGIAMPLTFTKTTRTLRNSINLLANRMGRNDVFDLRKNFGYLERRNALLALRNNKNIDLDFFITGEKDADDATSRELFIDNIFKHPYTLCVSGFGNYSYRLYEVLNAGRIPVFVDTDCKLPFEEFVDWNDYVVWINRKDIPRIGTILLDYHHGKKGDAFILQQKRNKAFWNEYLSPQQFFRKLKAYL